jgi:hypothetical protein
VISTLWSFEAAGTPCLGGDHPLICPGISCFVFSHTDFRPIIWVTWTAKVDVCSIARSLPRKRDSMRFTLSDGLGPLRGPYTSHVLLTYVAELLGEDEELAPDDYSPAR